MLYYPQLTTGAVSQFPVTRSTNMRTVANQLASGFTIRMADTGAQKVQWRLRYSSLTDGERSSIESLFEASEGPTQHVYLLRSHRQPFDVERGLDASSVDGRSAVAGDGRGAGSIWRQRRDATYEHRANDATDRSEHAADQVRFCTVTACMSRAMCQRRFSWLWPRPDRPL